MSLVIQKFYDLCKRAGIVLNSTYDSRKAEPIYLEILTYIKSNLDRRDEFARALLSILCSRDMPWEVIQFTMRELQWPEIKAELLSQMGEVTDDRIIGVINRILEVYDPVWEDSDLYDYYS